jgi:hypothetical protein
MMQQLPGRRALALVAALALATAGSAFAQDTTEAGGARLDTTEAAAGAIDTAGADTSAQMDRDTSAASDTTAATDTSAVRDTTDTSGVQNPPGYRGMERDTTLFPPEGGPPASPEAAAGQTTGTYGDSGDSGDSAAGDHSTHHEPSAGDTTAQTPDSAH